MLEETSLSRKDQNEHDREGVKCRDSDMAPRVVNNVLKGTWKGALCRGGKYEPESKHEGIKRHVLIFLKYSPVPKGKAGKVVALSMIMLLSIPIFVCYAHTRARTRTHTPLTHVHWAPFINHFLRVKRYFDLKLYRELENF